MKTVLFIVIVTFYSLLSFPQQFQLEWETPVGSNVEYLGDLDGGDIGEFLIQDSVDVVRVYDGLSHNLKWTFTLTQYESIISKFGVEQATYDLQSPLVDFNGNGVKDLMAGSGGSFKLLDPSSGEIIHIFDLPGGYLWPLGLDDVDNDNQLEFIIRKEFSNDRSFLIYSTGISTSSMNYDIPNIANKYRLDQNFPNPFNPSTTIRYSLAGPENIYIKIYDVSGQLVKEINKEHNQSGEYEVVWDGTNNFNERVTSGAYFYQISAGEYVEVKKMLLVK